MKNPKLISLIIIVSLFTNFISAVCAEEIHVGEYPTSNKLTIDKSITYEGKDGEAVVIMPDPAINDQEYWTTTLSISEEAGVLEIEPENIDISGIKKELEDFRTLYLWVWIPLNILLTLAVASN